MTTRFRVGQIVEARIAAQGLRDGQTFKVVGVDLIDGGFGGYVSYRLLDESGGVRVIYNGHLLLSETDDDASWYEGDSNPNDDFRQPHSREGSPATSRCRNSPEPQRRRRAP